MWEYIHHFRTEYADDGHIIKYCRLEFDFDQYSRASHYDQNLIVGKLCYIGKIQEIMQVDFSSFQCVIFYCKWRDTFDWIIVKEDHYSGLICINSKKMFVETKELYVFPKHCNQVIFYPDLLDGDWWFVMRHDPRSKHHFENTNVIITREEDNQGDDNKY
jgi:hypothetical protein